MKPTRIVVLGGGYSGVIAARRLAYKARGCEIVLINGQDNFVERIRLHQLAANQPLPIRPMQKMLSGTGIQFVKGWVTELSLQLKSLTLQTEAGPQIVHYDYLIYALGSYVDATQVPGAAEYALTVSTEKSALEFQSRLFANQGGRLVICGGGPTSIETAAELAETYPALKVSLITRERFGEQLSKRGQAHLQKVFDRLHIEVIDNVEVNRITAQQIEYRGGSVPYDLCFWAARFAVPALAHEAGLTVNARGQIIVDDHLRSISHPNVYAVGDAADLTSAISTPIRMACATAYPMGSYVADNLAARMLGKSVSAYDFAYNIRCISLGRHDGLIQIVDSEDNPQDRIISGRIGAWIKEVICRYAVWQIQNVSLMYYPQHTARQRQARQNHMPASSTMR